MSMIPKHPRILWLSLIVMTCLASLAFADTIDRPHKSDEIIIKFKATATPAQINMIMDDLGAVRIKHLKRIKTDHDRLTKVNAGEAIGRYKNHPAIEFIEPNYILNMIDVPNDARFDELWGMQNTGQTGGTAGADISATAAWDVFTGSRDVIVGVIDTGVDYNHPDLAANIWTNPGEIAGNGIDDDNNGYIDDIHGWDFINNDNDPMDDNGHGTHCSGTIGGMGNNGIGVIGVSPEVSIMGLKFLSGSGSGSLADALTAIEYATMMGADLTSNSWGGGGFSDAMYQAILDAGTNNSLFVAAAGNDGQDNDTSPHYPSNYDLDNVIAVAATDHNDEMASFSDWGLTTVDIAAPGVGILSTLPGGAYGSLSGTSMATPHVSGALALIKGRFPAIGAEEAKALLMNMADPLANLDGLMVSGARLNAFMAISDPDSIAPGQITDLATGTAGSNWLEVSWTATGDDDYTGKASRYDLRFATSPITDANWDTATPANGEPSPGIVGTFETMTVGGLDFSTTYYLAVKAMDEFGNPSPLSNVPMGITLGAPTVAVAPNSLSDALLTGGTSFQTLTLQNVGAGTLDFVIPTPTLIGGFAATNAYVDVPKGGVDPRPGQPAIEASGGPDAFGYRWTDSNDPFGPVFLWEEISFVGSVAMSSGDDASAGPFNIGFPFSFYGAEYTEFNVSSNGFISLTTGATDYNNQPLPSPGAPDHLIAPFWDDLDVSAGTVYYYSDGNRLIVEWDNVSHYGSGGPYSFQAILYADGSVEYMYDNMAAPLNSATIGVQNGDGSDGLNVVFNDDYVTDSLAVRIKAVPQWLTVTPTEGTVWSGSSTTLDVAFNASGLDGGLYDGIIRILSNDPNQPDAEVPVTLNVTGAPEMLVTPTAHDFGDLFIGSSLNTTIEVRNIGTDVLNVSGITLGDAAFTADQSAFVVAPGASQPVVVTFAPTLAGAVSTTMTVTSDDPNNPVAAVALSGNGQDPPSFAVNPASLASNLFTGNSEDQALTLTNDGGSDFTFDLNVDFLANVTVHDFVEIGKDDVDTRAGNPVVLGSGGPDIYGYRWVDSNDPGGPTYSFTDISTTGTPVFSGTADDTNEGPFPIGFDFSFYGTPFSEFNVCSNGFISFTSTSTSYSNQELPNSGAPENLIAPFWDDLRISTSTGANVFYEYDGSKLIVQFHRVPAYYATGEHTFQVILYPDGTILYQYETMDSSDLQLATVGIQNGTKDDGLSVAFNTPYVADGLAVRFQAFPEWLVVNPASGTIPAGGSLPVTATFNATNLFGGQYDANIVINSNDPAVPSLPVPAVLNVTGAPQMAVSQTAFDFGDNFIGTPTLQNLIITNMGTDNLIISAASVDNSDFNTSLTPPVTLGPTESSVVTVGYLAAAVGASTGSLTISSNDPTVPNLEITLAGAGLYPPIASVDPTSLFADLLTGESENQTLTLSNTGSSDLEFSAAALLVATEVQVHPYVEVGKGEVDILTGDPVTEGSGGPDLFGYRWIDSDEVGGPVFDWTDISGTGAQAFTADSDDRNSGALPIGFNFPFYGNTFSDFRVSSNGWVSFTSSLTSYSNQNLPNSGAPENLLAPFWDDLKVNPSSGGNVFYEYDGSKLIIQFDNVVRFSQNTIPITFQLYLYPNGTIVYQYLDMENATLTSATVGMQNDTKDDGLAMAYNTAYVHDGLAIRIQSLSDWLVVSPETGTVAAGGSTSLNVRFNAAGFFGGDYDGVVQVVSNDPVNGLIEVPTLMHVTGVPVLAVDPASLAFGDVFTGYTGDMIVTVTNTGTDQLLVADIGADAGVFTATPTVFELDPFASQAVTVTFAPTAAGAAAANLSLVSNDANSPAVVTLSGNGVIPPVVAVDPASIVGAAMPGGSKVKTLQVCNTGGSDLTWSLSASEGDISTAQIYDYLAVEKETEDPRAGILGSGGPDLFGHVWTDSDDPGGPTYDWYDITNTGTVAFGSYRDDGNVGPFPVGFTFPFYGQDFDSFRISSNGLISFTSTSSAYSNQPLPNSGAPENLLAVYWDDMVVDPSRDLDVYYQFDGTRLIVQYNIRRIGAFNPPYYSFQAILHPNGDILYQYRTLGSNITSATIGIQNGTKDDALMMVFNDTYVHENMAILISQEMSWLTAAPESGVIPAGECSDILVTMDAASLEAGDYTGIINLSSNDPATPTVAVDVLFHVGTIMAADADIDPSTLNLDSNGKWITGKVELPTAYDPADVVLETVLFNGVVVASAQAFSFAEDFNDNGIPDLQFKFDRSEIEDVLVEGEQVVVTITGEIRDTIYFVAEDTVRVIRPRMASPNGGETLSAANPVTITWENPESWNVDYADLYYTIDGGETWEEIASNITTTSYSWTPPLVDTQTARVRVFAFDNQGMLGFDSSDEMFAFASNVSAVDQVVPLAYSLNQNVPNPFNPRTKINFALLKGGYTELVIYDVRGRKVRSLVAETLTVGAHSAVWSGEDDHGQPVSSGLYFYRVTSGDFTETRKMSLLK